MYKSAEEWRWRGGSTEYVRDKVEFEREQRSEQYSLLRKNTAHHSLSDISIFELQHGS